MNDLVANVRHALRGFRKKPGFAVLVILTLALGIGANSALFSVVNGVLFRDLPYRNTDRLVFLANHFPETGGPESGISQAELLDWREQTDVFESVGGLGTGEQNALWTLTVDGRTEAHQGAFVTVNLFHVLGVDATLGRLFVPEEGEEGGDDVIALSDAFWRSRFGADREIIGRRLIIRGRDRTVVGVLPPGFTTDLNMPNAGAVDFWVPLTIDPDQRREFRFLRAIGRLAPGASLARARERVRAVARGFQEQFPEAYSSDTGYYASITPLHLRILGDIRTPLLVLWGTVAVVLLIACANVANLLLARVEARQREVAVRTALGAAKGRIVRLFVVETLLLTLAGGVVALGIAYGGIEFLRAFNAGDIPHIQNVALDLGVVGYTLLLAVATGLLIGIVPGLHAARTDITGMLREGGRGTSGAGRRARLRRTLVISQIALATVLVIGAGLLVKSLRRLIDIDLGMTSERVLTMRLDLPAWQYPEIEQVASEQRQILERVEPLAGVTAVSMMHAEHPLRLNGSWYFDVIGRPVDPQAARPLVGIRVVTPGLLETLRIPLIRGRFLDETDRDGSRPVVVINQAMAQRRFPNDDPLGRRLRPWNIGIDIEFEIVGVIGNLRNQGIRQDTREAILLPHGNPTFASGWRRHMTLMVRTTGSPTDLTATVRAALNDIDRALPITKVRTLEQVVSDMVAAPRFVTFLVVLFAGLALVIAAVGIYGVVSYTVSQRTSEIGVRIALGATAASVRRLVVRQGMAVALPGLGLGVIAALLLTRFVQSLLYEVNATDLPTFAGVTLVFASVAVVASYVPAYRASRIEPIEALRYE